VLRSILMLAGVAVIAAGVLASSASAGEAVLWACHGPGGQALGVPPLIAASAGDALATTYAGGCTAAAGTLADGGLRAAFTRPDPSGLSAASWRVDVPNGVTLEAVHLTRRTSGFGGAPVLGGGQAYVADTSAGPLETASVEDASNVALDGVLERDPAGGGYVRFGVSCTKSPAARCAAPGAEPLAVEGGAIAIRVADAAAPRGAVGGITSPAAGTLGLTLFATDAGLGLASAQATLDGTLVAVADLGGATCAELSAQDTQIDLPAGAGCPPSAATVALAVDTTHVADGPHQLRVTLRDAAGNEATIADESMAVANAVPQRSSQVALTIGTGDAGTPGGGGGGDTPGGGGAGASTPGPACRKPRLSMRLVSRPLRKFRGVPVLVRNRAYRYGGRLTCVVAGTRVSATRGTVVEILNVVGKRIAVKNGVAVRKRGAITVLLRYPSSRIVRFRHRSVDGSVVRVNIRIAVAHPIVRRRR
jgi:hypothetical protein